MQLLLCSPESSTAFYSSYLCVYIIIPHGVQKAVYQSELLKNILREGDDDKNDAFA